MLLRDKKGRFTKPKAKTALTPELKTSPKLKAAVKAGMPKQIAGAVSSAIPKGAKVEVRHPTPKDPLLIVNGEVILGWLDI